MDVPSPYSALADALRQRSAIIADREFYQRDPEAHLAGLMRVSESIVTSQAALPQPVPAQLGHFLERCSYDKALAYLDAMSVSEET